jgi:hypothetical protein
MDNPGSVMPSAEVRLLRACARLPPSEDPELLAALAAGIHDWSRFVFAAEEHGIAALVHAHLHELGAVPPGARQALGALVVRHRHANRTRFAMLAEILDALRARGIDAVVLKGAALAHLLYPDPALRAMRDLDVLVASGRAYDAREALRELGFRITETPPSRYSADHHHLPDCSIVRDGLSISVELHVDAMSRDAPESLTLDSLTEPLRPFPFAGTTARAFGHTDMLRHLCRHMIEPGAEIRLVHVADVIEYTRKFRDEIDWPRLRARHPFVGNTIALLHYLAPLPAELHAVIRPPSARAPAGVGLTMTPLSVLARSTLRDRLHGLFAPPDWWLHASYGVAPGNSLLFTRLARHPARLMRWVGRRLIAALSSYAVK